MKNISQSEIKGFLLKSTVFRAPHWNHFFHDGLLRVFLLREDRGRPSDLYVFTVNPYLSIFANYLTSYREREKYGPKNISQSEIQDFFAQIHGLPGFSFNLLFHDRLLTGFLLLEDRGRPSDLDICTATQDLSIFAKYLIGFRMSDKIWVKISRKVKLKVLFGKIPIEILCLMRGF